MSDDEQSQNTGTEHLAQMFADFMRQSLAHTKKVETDPPKIDTTPIILGFKMNGENYPLWEGIMKKTINSRGLVSHITGVPTPPPEDDPTFLRWQRTDNLVYTWLIQNLEQKIINRVSQYQTAREVWKSLAITHGSGGDTIQVYDLYRKATAVKQKDESMEDIWATLSDLWISIDQRKPNRMIDPTDVKIRDEEVQEQRLYQFLTALNDKYETLKREILRSKPLPSAEFAYGLLRAEEERLLVIRQEESTEKETSQGIGAGLAARRPWQNQQRPNPSNGGGGKSGGGGGSSWNKRTEEEKLKLVCEKCGRRKHTIETCFEILGYPDWWEERTGKRPPAPRGGRAAAAIAGSNTNPATNHGPATKHGPRTAGDEPRTGVAMVGIAREEGEAVASPTM